MLAKAASMLGQAVRVLFPDKAQTAGASDKTESAAICNLRRLDSVSDSTHLNLISSYLRILEELRAQATSDVMHKVLMAGTVPPSLHARM